MKISLSKQLFIYFILIVSLIFSSQIVFNLFFAKDIFVQYKSNLMQDAYEDLVNEYDGSLDSIENSIGDYEDKHNMRVLIRSKDEVIYTSLDEFMLRHELDLYKNSNKNIPKPDGFSHSTRPKVQITDYSERDSLDITGEFYFEETLYVSITIPVASIENSVDLFTISSLLISLIAILFCSIISFIISKKIVTPIKEIEQISNDYSNLDFRKKVNENIDSKELHCLSKSINSMAIQLEKSILNLNSANEKLQNDIDFQVRSENMRKEFIANVSHEMKTPLALLQVYTENLKNDDLDIDRDFYIETILEETNNLNEMVVSMLNISSIENGFNEMDFQPYSLSNSCTCMLNKMQCLLDEFNLITQIDDDIQVIADEKHIEQVMNNYLNNAIAHTNQGETIVVKLKAENDKTVFSVYNQGENIKAEDLPYLWDSFYRADKARTRNNKNIGMGLYIVKTIVEKHGGEYLVENLDNGVEFSFKIPNTK